MAYILRTDGSIEDLTDLSLESMQKVVGGYIETIPTNTKQVMVLNEDGKSKGLPENPRATVLARGVIAEDDWIVGDVIIASAKEID